MRPQLPWPTDEMPEQPIAPPRLVGAALIAARTGTRSRRRSRRATRSTNARDVHHHHVAGVLRPREAVEEREAHLHEQHEEAGDQRPCEVDADLVVTHLRGKRARVLGRALGRGGVVGRRLAVGRKRAAAVRGVGRRVDRSSGRGPARVSMRKLGSREDRDKRDQRHGYKFLQSCEFKSLHGVPPRR